jgi:hypothetical protein
MKKNRATSGMQEPSQEPPRKSVLVLAVVVVLGAIALLFLPKNSKNVDASANASIFPLQPEQTTTLHPSNSVGPRITSFNSSHQTLSDPHSIERARQLVESISQFNLDPLTPEKADQWKRELEHLIQEGPATVPALRDFFQSGANRSFETTSGTNLLGETTLRQAFLKVLFDIPAPDNVRLQAEILDNCSDPDEIALIARQLELQEPGDYRGLIIRTTRAALQKIKSGELRGRDPAPLTLILQAYGIPVQN